jgi:hypothetical protein
MNEDQDLHIRCELTGQPVLRCRCGPHEQCPEHTDCMIDFAETDEQFDQLMTEYKMLQYGWSERN